MNFHLTLKSSNKKTGPIPVSITSSESCPDSCPFQGQGCYAEMGPLALHWKRVDSGVKTLNLDQFCDAIKALPEGQMWRHNQAGDLPGIGEEIDSEALEKLVEANQGKRGFTYTHKPPTGSNAQAIKNANTQGFTINLSADNLAEADEFLSLGIAPVCVVLPSDSKNSFRTPNGNKVVICPAAIRDNFSCLDCKLCVKSKRKSIIGFPAHGNGKRKVDNLVSIKEPTYKYYEGNITVRQTEFLKHVHGIKIKGELTMEKVLSALRNEDFYDMIDTDTISIDSIVEMDLRESEHQGDGDE